MLFFFPKFSKETELDKQNKENLNFPFIFLCEKMFHQTISIVKTIPSEVVRPSVRTLSIPKCRVWNFLERVQSEKRRRRPPICHNPNPFRQFPALYHTKKLKRTWGFFSSRWDLSLFHTAHQVKLHPNVRNRNLKAILFPGKNGVAQTVVIWPDCTLTCPPEHRVSLVFKAAAEWPRFQTWAAWATADGKEGTVRQAGTSCFPAIHSNKMRCGAMTWQL